MSSILHRHKGVTHEKPIRDAYEIELSSCQSLRKGLNLLHFRYSIHPYVKFILNIHYIELGHGFFYVVPSNIIADENAFGALYEMKLQWSRCTYKAPIQFIAL